MSLPLEEHLGEVGRAVDAARRLLLLTDYDGTLAAIVDRPEDAVLDPPLRELLASAAKRQGLTVAVVSGRALDDVRRRVGVEGIIYAGNHGLEICGPRLGFLHPELDRFRQPIAEIAGELRRRLSGIAGVVVEDKRWTLSVHYRRTPMPLVADVEHMVRASVAARSTLFRVTAGKMVLEIRPQISWGKGEAGRWLRDQLGGAAVLPLVLGDDRTDEDAFASLIDGITIFVGVASPTAARFSIPSRHGVRRFLEWLCTRRPPGGQA